MGIECVVRNGAHSAGTPMSSTQHALLSNCIPFQVAKAGLVLYCALWTAGKGLTPACDGARHLVQDLHDASSSPGVGSA